MNLVLGVISLIFCTWLGYNLSKKFSKRREFYDDFSSFNYNLINEISFMQNSLPIIIEKYKEKSSYFYKSLRDKVINKIDVNLDNKIFSNEEIVFFNDYLRGLGKSDKKTQINFLENAKTYLKNISSKTTEEEKKYKSLYIKIGFLIGLIALIILL